MMNQPTNGRGRAQTDGQPSEAQLFAEILNRLDAPAPTKRQESRDGAKGSDGDTIDLVELMYFLLTKLHFIALGALVFAVLAGMYASTGVKMFSATAKLYLIGNSGTSIIADLQIGSYLTMDYQEVFRTWEVHQMVNDALGTNYSYSQMQSMLSVTNPEDTSVLYITVYNPDAQLAADMANAYADAAQRFITETMGTDEPSTFSVALVPSVAMGSNVTSSVIKGMLVGTVLVGGILVVFFLLDKRPKSPDDLMRYAGIPTLAVIPDNPNLSGNVQRARKRVKA